MELSLTEGDDNLLEISETPVILSLTADGDSDISINEPTSVEVIEIAAGLKGDKGDPGTGGAGGGTIADISGLQPALDAKAPLASPAFTGTVTGITKNMVGLGNVSNTSDVNKPISTATQTALDAKAPLVHTHTASAITDFTTAVQGIVNTQLDIAGAPGTLDTINELAAALGDDPNFAATLTSSLASKAPLASPTFTGTVSGITAAMVGLGNVNNTSDANKPVSSATQTALNLKAPLASPAFTGTVTGITAAMVGAATTSHSHAASDITSGVIPTARLGTGTQNTTTFLRGDGTWATVSAGGGSTTLSGLSDVTVSSPAIGNFLRYNGTVWVNANPSASDVGLGTIQADVNKKIDFVLVSTGSEARPSGSTVTFWVDTRNGSPTEPTNMGANDRWFT